MGHGPEGKIREQRFVFVASRVRRGKQFVADKKLRRFCARRLLRSPAVNPRRALAPEKQPLIEVAHDDRVGCEVQQLRLLAVSLLRLPRLSVVPLTEAQYLRLLELGETGP